jgi:hypothetical protein
MNWRDHLRDHEREELAAAERDAILAHGARMEANRIVQKIRNRCIKRGNK